MGFHTAGSIDSRLGRLDELAAMAATVRLAPESSDSGGAAIRRRPEQTFAAVEPFLKSLGITRVGDLTALDTIGIPVWFACRPNSKSLAVSQGKGLRHSDARVGAVMEAVEDALAESPKASVTRHASWEALQSRHRVIPFEKIARCSISSLDPRAERAWVPGISLSDGETVFAPFELVGLDFSTRSPWDHSAFRMSSIGLAAGETLCDAIVHGLLEIVEHAATTCFEIFGANPAFARPISFRPGDFDLLDEAIRRVRAAGVDPIFVDLTRDTGIPVVGAFVELPSIEPGGRAGSIYSAGFAARLSLAEAALSALLEAAQTRLTDIAGARDDIRPEDYRVRTPGIAQLCRQPAETPAVPRSRLSSEAQLGQLLGALDSSGIHEFFVFPFDVGEMSLRSVRVIGSACEAPGDGHVSVLSGSTLDTILRCGTDSI